MWAKWVGSVALVCGVLITTENLMAQQLLLGFGNSSNCRPEIEKAITDLGIKRDEIESIEIVEIAQNVGDGDRLITGWNGWMRPVGVKGYLVVQVSRQCVVSDVYTRGDYQRKGVPHY